MVRAELLRWLQSPRLTGWQALICGLLAIWVPSVIRLAVNGVVTGCEFTPYLPFVLVCAILLRWWQAAAVSLLSVATLGGLFGGSTAFHLSCFMPAALMFLGSSAAVIGIAEAIRRVAAPDNPATDRSSGGILFSVEKGQVWASWYGEDPPVLLGTQRKVLEKMRDFLARQQPGRRLPEE